MIYSSFVVFLLLYFFSIIILLQFCCFFCHYNDYHFSDTAIDTMYLTKYNIYVNLYTKNAHGYNIIIIRILGVDQIRQRCGVTKRTLMVWRA